MRTTKRQLAALTGGALLTLLGGTAQAQAQAQTQTPAQAEVGAAHPAYYVAEFELRDPEGIRPYSAGVVGTFEPFGGHFIVRGGRVVGLEGTPPGARTVIVEFPSLGQAQAWYNSPAYTALRPIRQRSGVSRTYIIDGLPPR